MILRYLFGLTVASNYYHNFSMYQEVLISCCGDETFPSLWSKLEVADFGHNSIATIDESLVSLLLTLYKSILLISSWVFIYDCPLKLDILIIYGYNFQIIYINPEFIFYQNFLPMLQTLLLNDNRLSNKACNFNVSTNIFSTVISRSDINFTNKQFSLYYVFVHFYVIDHYVQYHRVRSWI